MSVIKNAKNDKEAFIYISFLKNPAGMLNKRIIKFLLS